MRTIKQIHTAISDPIGDLITYRAMPTSSISHADPFLFLNHHGPQVYPGNNQGLPFGPHPHRGFETLTFIYEGDLVHWDSNGGKSIINKGGIQWMTAGSGLIHAEISSDEFKKNGGRLEIIQLWINLPSRLKMIAPKYTGLQKESLPVLADPERKLKIVPVAGRWETIRGPVEALTGIEIASLYLSEGGQFETEIEEKRTILLYAVRGDLIVNNEAVHPHDLVEFEARGRSIHIRAEKDSLLILGHGEPYNEPIVAQGPFVMNSSAEIQQAWQEYREGKMGQWANRDYL